MGKNDSSGSGSFAQKLWSTTVVQRPWNSPLGILELARCANKRAKCVWGDGLSTFVARYWHIHYVLSCMWASYIIERNADMWRVSWRKRLDQRVWTFFILWGHLIGDNEMFFTLVYHRVAGMRKEIGLRDMRDISRKMFPHRGALFFSPLSKSSREPIKRTWRPAANPFFPKRKF